MNQLASFLAKSHEIPKDKKDRFLNELSDKKKKQISDYLIQLLYNIEDQRKSSILGYIYKYRLLEELSKDKNPSVQNDIMLRMCHAINNVYTDNLLHVKKYESYIEDKDIITDDLFHVGLLEQSFKQTNQLPNIPTAQYRLNPIGKKLMETVENYYKDKGFENMNLTTYGFQAPEFYIKCGFEIEFIRKNKNNPKLDKYFMVKYF